MAHNQEAVFAADLFGHDDLKADDGEAAVKIWSDFEQVFAEHIHRHHGRVLNTAAEASFLAAFSSGVEAVSCAVELQRDLADRSKTRCRIGVDHGDPSPGGEAPACGEGAGVYRLVALAEPGGVCLSRPVYEEVRFRLDLPYDTKRDSRHTVFTCGEIRQKRHDLSLLESSAVRIGPAALTGEPRGSRVPFKDASNVIHKIMAVFGR